jgi:chemotaxis protein MotC
MRWLSPYLDQPLLKGAATLLLLAALAVSNPVRANPTLQPYEIVRALQSLQDGMLAGRQDAISVYNALLQKAPAEMLAAPDEVWRDRRNVIAAASIVFIGGDGRLAAKVREQGETAGLDASLVELVESFAAGRLDAVRKASVEADLLALPKGLGAVAAIAGARVWQARDAAKASEYYDMARLLGNGGLVEEAAIRSQLGLAVANGDRMKAELLMRQYFHRMLDSVFAGVATTDFAQAIVTLDYEQSLPRLAGLLDAASSPERFPVELHRKLIRAAVEARQYAVARLTLQRLSDGAQADTNQEPALQLLDLVARLHESGPGELLQRLKLISREQLSGEDRQLYDAMNKIAGSIERWPEEPEADAAARPSKYRPANRLPRPVTPTHPDLGKAAVRALNELGRVEQLIERM